MDYHCHLASHTRRSRLRNYNYQFALLPHVPFYVMDSSPDAAVIDYTRQKEIESQVAVSHKNHEISVIQEITTFATHMKACWEL